MAGRGYSVLPFIFDLINTVNETKAADSTGRAKKDKLPKDPDGAETTAYLKKVLKTVSRITGKDPTSLGLHPVVYFYTRGGAFSPWSFLAWAKIVNELFDLKRVNQFCDIRPELERYLIAHKWAMTEIIHKNGSGSRSTPWLEKYWRMVYAELSNGRSYNDTVNAITESTEFGFLKFRTPAYMLPGDNPQKRIGKATKTAAIWDSALPGAPRCSVCKGIWHRNSIHGEHKIAIREGGDGRPSNTAIAHPYCDSAYKDYLAKKS